MIYSLYLINKATFGDKGNAIYLSGYQVFVLMLTFSSIGVPNAISNYVAQNNSHKVLNKIFKSAILIYLSIAGISSILLFGLSNKIANNILGINFVEYNLKLLSPIIIFTTLESIYLGFFNGIKQMKITAKIQVIEQLSKTILTIVLVECISRKTNDPGILSIGATLAVSISIIISFLLCYSEKRRIKIFAKNFDDSNVSYKDIIIKLLRFSIPVSLGGILIGVTKNCDSFAIMNILSKKIGTIEAQKIYGIIASKIDALLVLPMSFNLTFSVALIPNISEYRKKEDYKYLRTIIENAIFMSAAIGIVSFLGLYFFGEDIFDLLFSNSKNGTQLLKLASFSIIFSVLNQTFIGILQGFEKNRVPVIASLCGALIKIVLNVILVNQSAFFNNGIIISTIISNIIMCFITYKEVRKNIRFSLTKYFIINFLLGIIMICLIKFMYKVLLFFNIWNKIAFVFSAIFGGSLFFCGLLISGYFLGFFKHFKLFKK